MTNMNRYALGLGHLLLASLAGGCFGSPGSGGADETPFDSGAAPDSSVNQRVACVYRLGTWSTCTDGITTTSYDWKCEPRACELLDGVDDTSVGGVCVTGGAKIDRIELPGECSTYLPPGASSPKLPTPDFEPKTNPELLKACLRALTRDQSCQETTVDPDCEHFAKVEGPQAIAAYDRIAATPCGTTPDPGLEVTTLGDTLCAAREEKCCPRDEPCNDQETKDWCETLNRGAAWLRSDVQAAVSACLYRLNCDEWLTCVNGWVDAIWSVE